jgi:hypothetical protein
MDLAVDLAVDLAMDWTADLAVDLTVNLAMDLTVDLAMDLTVDLAVDWRRGCYAIAYTTQELRGCFSCQLPAPCHCDPFFVLVL